jgi:glycosyltransferase involved in cell wall biosynthesis
MNQDKKKILIHLPFEIKNSSEGHGGISKNLGLLKYFSNRKDFFSVDAFGCNGFGYVRWDSEQIQEVLKFVDNFFVYKNERNLLDRMYSLTKRFYYHILLQQQFPVDSDYYTPPGYVNFVYSLVHERKYDFIWIQWVDYAHLAANPKLSSVHTIIDVVDLPSEHRLVQERFLPTFKGKKFDYESNFIKQVKLLNKFNAVIVASQKEMEMIKRYLSPDKLYLIPYATEERTPRKGMTVPYSQRDFKYDLIFVGSSWNPNIEGINFFLTSIFPKIVKKRPETQLVVAGKVSDFCQIEESIKQNVDCLGYVPDVLELYTKSRLMICPLLSGSGTKMKLQEAMGFALPIVTTTIGASGLSLKDGVNAFITDEPDLYARRIINLLEEPELAQKISEEIAMTFESQYSSSVIYSKLDKMLGIIS